jgi:thioredoxin-related protein
MKNKLILILFVAGLFTMLSAKDLQWKKYNAGVIEAKKSGKKVLVDVYTDWCKWCKKMDEVTYKDGKVKAYLEKNFVVIKLDAEGTENVSYQGRTMAAPQFAKEMQIDGYPATLFMKSSGEAITVLPGYSEPAMFLNVLSYIKEEQYSKKNFEQYLKEKGVQ